ncbi:MAG: 16S rRNA (cytidine(1402)-2'-O)-methyltransferase [Pseudomonadota bacterium]
MNFRQQQLSAGLYMVATPIGTARDITLRALDILASADVLAAEDTRTLRKLMDIHGVPLRDRQIVAYHDHNGAAARPRLLAAIAGGASVAYASEAGTPLIADPGFDLAVAARADGHLVTSAPGPSAVVTALSIAGLPTDRFHFAGFAPPSRSARQGFLADLREVAGTLVLYEAPGRVAAMLRDAAEVLGDHREAALCRELTKRFEEVRRGTLADLAQGAEDTPPKGECVILIDRQSPGQGATRDDIEAQLNQALSTMRLKDAATAVAGAMGLRRRDVYQIALEMKEKP